jgi:hypothetical protein
MENTTVEMPESVVRDLVRRLKGMTDLVDESLDYRPGYGDVPLESTLRNRTQTLEDLRTDLGQIADKLLSIVNDVD